MDRSQRKAPPPVAATPTCSLRLQQGIAGAANDHANAVSVCKLENDLNFTVYGSGSNTIILDGTLSRVQVIANDDGAQVTTVDMCPADGKLAIGYASGVVVICRPRKSLAHPGECPYTWLNYSSIDLPGGVNTVAWDPKGRRLVVGGERISVWACKREPNASQDSFDDGSNPTAEYLPLFSRKVASEVACVKVSPDGMLFATMGKVDRLVKVWYARSKQFASVFQGLDIVESEEQFDFLYLPHPRPVTSFSWRRVCQAEMETRFVCNVLLTSCQDNICRLWSETPADEPLKFYVCGVINPDEYSSLKRIPGQAFVLHWLNTHEVHREMIDARRSATSEADLAGGANSDEDVNKGHIWCSEPWSVEDEDEEELRRYIARNASRPAPAPGQAEADRAIGKRGSRGKSRPKIKDMPAPHTPSLELPASVWYKKQASDHTDVAKETWPDMVFFVHPEGSIVFWSIRMLDTYPRQIPQVKLASWTVPGVIPCTDASQLHPNVIVYPSSIASKWWFKRGASGNGAAGKRFRDGFKYVIKRPLPLTLLMHHRSGSISEWQATFVEKSSFSAVSRVEATARSSGHRRPVTLLQTHPCLDFALSVGEDNHCAELRFWRIDASLGMPLRARNILHESGHHFIQAPNSKVVTAWFPTNGVFAMLVSTGDGISVLTGGKAPGLHSNGPSIVETALLPDSGGVFSNLFVHAADVGMDAETFWAFGIAAPSKHGGGATTAKVWRVTIVSHMTSTLQKNSFSPTSSPQVSPSPTRRNMGESLASSLNSGLHVSTPLDTPHPAVLSRVEIAACELSFPGTAPSAAASQMTCASMINCTMPHSASSSLATLNSCVLMVGYDDAFIRCWNCRFERASEETLSRCASLHESGSVSITYSPAMDEQVVHAGKALVPIRFETTYDGLLALVGQYVPTSADSEANRHRVMLYDFALTGTQATCVGNIRVDKKVQSITWGARESGQSLLFIKLEDSIQTYAIGSAQGGQTALATFLTNTAMPSELPPCANAELCVVKSAAVITSHNAELFAYSMWLTNDIEGSPKQSTSTRDARLLTNTTAARMSNVLRQSIVANDAQPGHAAGPAASQRASAVSKEETITNLSDVAAESCGLPLYHADQLSEMLLGGKKLRAKRIVECLKKHVDIHCEKEDLKGKPTAVFAMSLATMVSDGAVKETKAEKKNDYGSLFGVDKSSVLLGAPADDGPAASTFTPQVAKELCELTQQVQLDRLSRREQVLTLAVVESIADMEANQGSLDECGMRFYVPVRMAAYLKKVLPQAQEASNLSSSHFTWALLSETQDRLLELCPTLANNPRSFLWEDLRCLGAGYWLRRPQDLKSYVLKVAKNLFAKTNKPLDAAVWYLALGKKSLLWGLFKSVGDARMASFFGNDFSQERWKTAAMKNAYALLGKQRFSEAVAFFILAGELKDAVSTCLRSLQDTQMALVICRLVGGEDSGAFRDLVQQELVNKADADPFLGCVGHWIKKEYSSALKVLLDFKDFGGDCGDAENTGTDKRRKKSDAPAILNLCRFLQNHILLRGTVTGKSQARPVPNSLFVKVYYKYVNRGMPLLALDTLADLCAKAKAEEASTTDDSGADTQALASAPAADPFAFNMASFGGGGATAAAASSTPSFSLVGKPKPIAAEEPPKPSFSLMGNRPKPSVQVTDDAPPAAKPSFSLMGSRPKPAAQEEAKPSFSLMGKRKPAPASQGSADSFAFDMGAFGGFAGMGTMSVATATPEPEPEKADGPAKDGASGDQQERVNFSLVRTWQLMCGVQLIADYLLYWRTARPSWTTFQETLNREIDSIVRVCEGESFPTTRLDRRLLRRSLLSCTRLSKSPAIRCALMLTVDCRSILPMLSSMAAELGAFIATYAIPELHRKVFTLPKAPTKARIDFLVAGLAECLQVMSSFRLPKACRPSAIQLAEYICVLYGALYIVAWHERDLSMVLRLLAHKPAAPLWSRLGPSCDTAIATAKFMEQLARKDPFALRRHAVHCSGPSRSVLDYIRRHLSTKDYQEVDEGANLDAEGNHAEILPDFGSVDEKAKNYRWALLELVSGQRFLESLRSLGMGAGLDASEQTQASPLFLEVMSALEHRTAILQTKMDALDVPELDEAEALNRAAPQTAGREASHVVRGLFKVRSLFSASNNKFGGVHSRRLWHFLVRLEPSQPTIEYYMFHRQSKLEPVHDTEEDTPVTTIQISHSELRAMCMNSSSVDSMVIGSSRGLCEVWLNKNVDDDLDDDTEFGEGIAAHGTKESLSNAMSGGMLDMNFSPPPEFSSSTSLSRSPSPPSSRPSSRPSSPIRFKVMSPGKMDEQRPDSDIVGLQRAISGTVRVLAAHPSMPCYLSGSSDGSVKLWHFDQDNELCSFSHSSNAKVNAIRFEDYGNKFGVANNLGEICLWRVLSNGENDTPYITIKAHSKRTDDFVFLSSSTQLASAGLSSDGIDVSIWDTIVQRASQEMSVPTRSFNLFESGAKSLAYSRNNERLICGSNRGEIAVIDLRQHSVLRTWDAHDGVINKILVDEDSGNFITASASGNVKIWSATTLREVTHYDALHAKSGFFSQSGVLDMAIQRGFLYTIGADSFVKKIKL